MLRPRIATGRNADLFSQYPHGGYFYFILLKKERIFNMKKTIKSAASIILALVFIMAFVSCNKAEKTGVWENATYREDMEFGEGSKTVVVEVAAEGQTVTFTIKTDKDTVGAALIENGLIDGEEGPYGLYIKVVNGMTADYDVDQSYWSFYINGEYAMTGVEKTDITEGTTYKLEYTK